MERYRQMLRWRPGRPRTDSESTVSPLLQAFVREQTRAAKTLAAITEAFEANVPPNIARECTLLGLKAGVVTVETSSPAVQFALDRTLRGGAEAAIRNRLEVQGVKVTKLRVRYAQGAE